MTLVWDEFFDLHDTGNLKSRYSLEDIASKNREDFKNIVDEFFFSVYYKYYMENGFVNFHLYDPEILKWMGLPPDAGFEEIKKRFRELAKKYHPDTGGDGSRFIELMENYKKLIP
jgi:DnaJ-domain-containing protein 1